MKQSGPVRPAKRWFVVIARDPDTGKYRTASDPLSRDFAIKALLKQWASNRMAYLHPRK